MEGTRIGRIGDCGECGLAVDKDSACHVEVCVVVRSSEVAPRRYQSSPVAIMPAPAVAVRVASNAPQRRQERTLAELERQPVCAPGNPAGSHQPSRREKASSSYFPSAGRIVSVVPLGFACLAVHRPASSHLVPVQPCPSQFARFLPTLTAGSCGVLRSWLWEEQEAQRCGPVIHPCIYGLNAARPADGDVAEWSKALPC
jgi:hypothetical protein